MSSDFVGRKKPDFCLYKDRNHELFLQEVDEHNVKKKGAVNSSLYSPWKLPIMNIEAFSY